MPKERLEDDDEELEDDEAVELSADLAKANAGEEDEPDDDTEEESDEDSEDESDEDDSEVDSDDDEPPARSSKKDAKARITELAKKRRAAEAAAFELELKNIALEKRLQALEEQSQTTLTAPKADDFTYGEVDPDYINAMVDYRTETKLREMEGKTKKSSEEALAAKEAARYQGRLDEVMKAGTKKHADFAEAINSTVFDAELARSILDSDNAVDIAYYLSNNIGDLRTLTRADPAERARALGRLEGRFSVASTAKKKTKAPEPLGSRNSKASAKGDGKYGPESQDAFDKAFFR